MKTTVKNTFLNNYIISNINVQCEYLYILARYVLPTNQSFFDIAPKMQEIKESLSNREWSLLVTSTRKINNLVREALAKELEACGLEYLCTYNDDSLNEDIIIKLSSALAIRKSICTLPNIEPQDELESLLASMVEETQRITPSISIESMRINKLKPFMIVEYLQALGIEAEGKNSVLKYLYESITAITKLTSIAENINRLGISPTFLYNEFAKKLELQDLTIYEHSFSYLENLISKINQKKSQKKRILKDNN